jgi:carbon-monoxide dehydrogenase medium subunit
VNLKEFARRAGDFAIVAVMSAIEVRENVITDARLCAGGVSDRALRLVQAEAVLIGQAPTPETFAQAASLASQEADPNGDLHGSKEFRQDLVKALTKRSLAGSLT